MCERVYVRLNSRDIDLFAKIIEACGHIGIVSTVDAAAGLVVVNATPDTGAEVRQIIAGMPFPAEVSAPPDQEPARPADRGVIWTWPPA